MTGTGRIATLRRRFVLYAMAAVAVVLLVVGLAVNLSYDAQATAELDAMLSLIAQGQGSLPTYGRRGSQSAQQGLGEDAYEGDDDDLLGDDDLWDDWDWEGWRESQPLLGSPLITPETAYSTRWFSVTYDGSGNIAYVDLANIVSVDRSDLPRFVEVAARAGDGFGTVGDFRYLVSQSAGYHQAYFLDAATEFHAMRSLAILTAIVGVVAFGLIALAVWFLAGRAIRPVAEADARQRRFVTDASHELKTPLAVILTSLGVAEMEVGENRFIDKAKAQTNRMAELVDELVTFSRIDEGQDREPAPFDASAATMDVASGFESYGEERGHELRIEVEPDLSYMGDEYGYRRLVSVLLDNAIKYATEGGAVTLSLGRWKRRGLRLSCENPAEGIDEGQLPQLFERFWRPDDSRSRETGGFGIGLSIAREVVEQAGGTIAATLPTPTTIRFEALLP